MADSLPALLQKHKEEIKALLPGYLDVERFILNAQTVANNRDLANCSPDSLYRCCLDAARKGWEVGGGSKHCAVVAFKLKSGGVTAILIPQWQGKAFLWSKSGAIKKLKAEVVYAGDTFEIESGDEDRLVHRPDYLATRTPSWLNKLDNIIGAYAIAWLASGERVHSFVSRSQIARTMESVRKKNDGKLGFGWEDWLPEMCRKTAIHRLDGVIQPPPDMTPEQLEAWSRVRAGEPFDAETTADELPADDLPTAGVAQTGEQSTRNAQVAGSTPAASSKLTLTADKPPATIKDTQDEEDLLEMWRKVGRKRSELSPWLKENYGIDDLADFPADQKMVAECSQRMASEQ